MIRWFSFNSLDVNYFNFYSFLRCKMREKNWYPFQTLMDWGVHHERYIFGTDHIFTNLLHHKKAKSFTTADSNFVTKYGNFYIHFFMTAAVKTINRNERWCLKAWNTNLCLQQNDHFHLFCCKKCCKSLQWRPTWHSKFVSSLYVAQYLTVIHAK